jgi:hypothetical protein
MDEIKLSLEWLFAVIVVAPVILLVVFLVKDRLHQWPQEDRWRSDDALGHGALEHSVVAEVIDTVQDKRTDEDRSRLLRLLQELEARLERNVDGRGIRRNVDQLRVRQMILEQGLNQLEAELKRNGNVVR